MATDYSKKTNAELIEILKSRSLPHTGKKAELVARLQESDKAQAEAPVAPATSGKADAADDVIDWEDDEAPADGSATAAAKPSTEAAASTIAAGGKGPVDNPVAVPNQKLDIDPSATHELKVQAEGVPHEDGKAEEAAAEAEKKPAPDFSRGLPETELEEELRKRKARAEKFGITEDSETAVKEAEKKLERAKRFGSGAEGASIASSGVGRLDQALPERSRKRGRSDNDHQGGRGGKRRDFEGRNRFRRRRGGGGGGGNRNDNQNRGQRDGGNKTNDSGRQESSFSDKDRLAMDARKKRFATAA